PGSLSENPRFAEACAGAGIVFGGPPEEAMRLMGNKTAARAAVSRRGVAVIPGTLEPLATVEEAAEAARRIGYPVMLKAAAGGGGKGRGLVAGEARLGPGFEAGRSVAPR